MVNLWNSLGRLAVVLLAGVAVAPAQQYAQQNRIARPGTVNYVEGQVSLNGRTLNARSIGSAEAAAGQVLETQNGRAEMLLTPGVFVRLNSNTAVQMTSPDLVDTRVAVLRGEAMVEADYVTKDNHIAVADNGFNVNIEKNGVYDFNATQPKLAVYDGEAQVTVADKTFNVKKGKELALNQTVQKPKETSFDTNTPSTLYSWSRLRSEYMTQANEATVQNIFVGGYGYPWWGGYGWYWNPYFDSFAFIPGYGYGFSPFGYPFYSPAFYGMYGFYGHRGAGVFGHPAVRPGVIRTAPPAAHFSGNGGFGGVRSFSGGGFHGGFGGGGFHGGGGRR